MGGADQTRWTWDKPRGKNLTDVALNGCCFHDGFRAYNTANETQRRFRKCITLNKRAMPQANGGWDNGASLGRDAFGESWNTSMQLATAAAPKVERFGDVFGAREKRHSDWDIHLGESRQGQHLSTYAATKTLQHSRTAPDGFGCPTFETFDLRDTVSPAVRSRASRSSRGSIGSDVVSGMGALMSSEPKSRGSRSIGDRS